VVWIGCDWGRMRDWTFEILGLAIMMREHFEAQDCSLSHKVELYDLVNTLRERRHSFDTPVLK